MSAEADAVLLHAVNVFVFAWAQRNERHAWQTIALYKKPLLLLFIFYKIASGFVNNFTHCATYINIFCIVPCQCI